MYDDFDFSDDGGCAYYSDDEGYVTFGELDRRYEKRWQERSTATVVALLQQYNRAEMKRLMSLLRKHLKECPERPEPTWDESINDIKYIPDPWKTYPRPAKV